MTRNEVLQKANQVVDATAIGSGQLVCKLVALDERPWATFGKNVFRPLDFWRHALMT